MKEKYRAKACSTPTTHNTFGPLPQGYCERNTSTSCVLSFILNNLWVNCIRRTTWLLFLSQRN